MPWETTWYDADKTIIHYEVTNPLTWEEFLEGIQQGQAMEREKDYLIETIFVLAPDLKLPSANVLPYFRNALSNTPENNALNTVVGAPNIIKTFVNIITNVMPGQAKFVFVSSIEEALATIEQARAERASGAG